MLIDFFCATLSRVLNQYIKLDPEGIERLKKLETKVITIAWPTLNMTFQCRFSQGSVFLSKDEILASDAKLSGTPLMMFSLLIAKDRQAYFREDLQIEGDVVFASEVLRFFDEIEWDVEEYLSTILGDVIAHRMGQMGRELVHFVQSTKISFGQNVKEYLQEEINLFPLVEALHDFYKAVDELRMDTDRITARIYLLLDNMNKMEKE